MSPDLIGFATAVLDSWPDGGIDGGDLQDLGVRFGLLSPVTVTEPCNENCHCAEYYDEFPAECLRRVPLTNHHDALVEALRKLQAEVSAILFVEDALRDAAGHTNVNVLMLRRDEAKAVLARVEQEAQR